MVGTLNLSGIFMNKVQLFEHCERIASQRVRPHSTERWELFEERHLVHQLHLVHKDAAQDERSHHLDLRIQNRNQFIFTTPIGTRFLRPGRYLESIRTGGNKATRTDSGILGPRKQRRSDVRGNNLQCEVSALRKNQHDEAEIIHL